MTTRELNDVLEVLRRGAAEEEKLIDELGQRIGYGRIMQATQKVWRVFAKKEGIEGTELVSGPCAAQTVTCFCRRPGSNNSSCDLCCGCGWLTKAVAQLVEHLEGGE